jgi:hypothetical protein
VRQVALDEPRTTQVPLDEPLPLSHAITLRGPADVRTPKAPRAVGCAVMPMSVTFLFGR